MTGCNPEQQALDRALAETDEEWRERTATNLDRIPVDRLIDIINMNLES